MHYSCSTITYVNKVVYSCIIIRISGTWLNRFRRKIGFKFGLIPKAARICSSYITAYETTPAGPAINKKVRKRASYVWYSIIVPPPEMRTRQINSIVGQRALTNVQMEKQYIYIMGVCVQRHRKLTFIIYRPTRIGTPMLV